MNVLLYGLMVAVIGMAIVFLGLIILIFCVWLMGKVFRAIAKSKEEKAAEPVAVEPVAASVETAPVQDEAVVDDAQLIAVIAAAIAAFDNSGKNLVVRKVRRINGWNGAARREQVYHF